MATETLPPVHHWIIPAAAGPTSPGVCRLCGEEREFENWLEPKAWGGRGFGNRPGRQPKVAAAE